MVETIKREAGQEKSMAMVVAELATRLTRRNEQVEHMAQTIAAMQEHAAKLEKENTALRASGNPPPPAQDGIGADDHE